MALTRLNECKLAKFLITGGAGFIGSAVIRYLIGGTQHTVLNFDKLTYAGNLKSLVDVSGHSRYSFRHGDICDANQVEKVFADFQPDVVMHLAAVARGQVNKRPW